MKKYFAKNGEIFGPYSEFELTKIQSKISDFFTWIWNDKIKSWDPLDPAPVHSPLEVQKNLVPNDSTETVILHDQKNILSGVITHQTNEVYFVRLVENLFIEKSTLALNLLDSKSGETTNKKAHIKTIKRVENHWIYQLQVF